MIRFIKNTAALPALAALLLLAACQPSPTYQQQFAIPGQAWAWDYQPVFKFQIEDTAAAYQLFFLIRHTDAYAYNNIWLKLSVKSPGDSAFGAPTRVEVPLAEAIGLNAGKWLGRGTGNIYEQRMALSNASHPTYFPTAGQYEIRLQQDMRLSPLPDVYQVGLRVDKTNVRTAPASTQ